MESQRVGNHHSVANLQIIQKNLSQSSVRMSNKTQFFFALLALIMQVHSAPKNITAAAVGPCNGTATRMDLHYGTAQAQGQGEEGGVSGSYQTAWGYTAGRKYPNGAVESYGAKAGTEGDSYKTGDDAPNTYAQATSNVEPGVAEGTETASVEGGAGEAQTSSYSKDYEKPLPDGSVIYRDLKTNATIHAKHPRKQQSNNSTRLANSTLLTNSKQPRINPKDVLVLH